MRTMRVILVATLAIFLGTSCGSEEEGNEAGTSQTLTVEAFDYYFDPTALSVDTGASVTIELTNAGSVQHSWTSTDLDAEVDAASGESATLTFTAPAEPGSYDFFCEYHPDDMQGTISIGGSDEPAEEQPDDEEDDADVEVDVDEEEDTTSDDDY